MRKLLIALLAVVILAVAAVLAGPSLIDWNGQRQRVAAELGALLGQPVALDGGLDIRLLPQPRLTASRVTIGAPDAAARITIGDLDLGVELLPLLAGRVNVRHLILAAPTLRLTRAASGTVALGDLAGLFPAKGRLQRVVIENGTILLHDVARGRDDEVSGLSLQLNAPDVAGPYEVFGALRLNGLALNVDATAGRRQQTGIVPVAAVLHVPAAGARIAFTGQRAADGGVQGTLSADGADLGAALGPFIAPGAVLPAGGFALDGQLAADADGLRLDGLDARVGAIHAVGHVAVAPGPEAAVTAVLSVNRIGLDPWLGTDAGAALAALRGWLAGGPALPAGFAGRFDLQAAAIDWRGSPLRDVALTGSYQGGRVTVDRCTARLPGGSRLTLSGTITSAAAGPSLALHVDAEPGDLRRVLDWLGADTAALPLSRLRRVGGSADLALTPDRVAASHVALSVDGAAITGEASLAQGDRPALSLRARIEGLDLDSYGRDGALALARAGGWLLGGTAGLLDRLSADIDLQIARIAAAGFALSDGAVTARLSDGALELDTARLTLADGSAAALSGRIGRLDPLADADLTLSIDLEDPAALARQGGVALPGWSAALGPVHLGGTLRGDPAALAADIAAVTRPVTLALRGTLDVAAAPPQFDLDATLQAAEVSALARLGLPDYRPPGDLGGVSLTASVAGAPDEVTLTSLSGTVGPLAVTGAAGWSGGFAAPRLSFDLHSGPVVLAHFLPSGAAAGASAAGDQPDARWGPQPLHLDGLLPAVPVEIAWHAASLQAGPWHLDTPDLAVRLAGDTVTLDRLSAGLLGGTVTAAGRLGLADGADATLTASLAGVPVQPLLATAFGGSTLTGRLDGRVALASRGRNPAELVNGLTGTGHLGLADGTLAGFDLGQANEVVGAIHDPLKALSQLREALRQGSTAFDRLDVPLVVDHGIVTVSGLRLSGPHIAAGGGGVIDLPRWSVTLQTEVRFTDHPDLSPLLVQLSGAPDAPARTIQTQALQIDVAQRAAEALSRMLGAEDGVTLGGETQGGPAIPAPPEAAGGASGPAGG